MICFTYARSSTLRKVDSISQLCQWSVRMQLRFALFDRYNQQLETSTPDRVSTAWDDIDETSRLTALTVLARLIAQMLAAEHETEASDD
jgi:hypothetical protein